MKKNKMMRLASVLLVLTLLSTSVISGTFAKYTTQDSASDSARVAKWGVELQVVGNLFGDTYDKTNKIVVDNAADITVQSKNAAEEVVAPGTENNEGFTFSLKGTPEVSGEVTATIVSENIYLNAGTYGVMVKVPDGVVTAENYDEFLGLYTYDNVNKTYSAATDFGAGEFFTLEDEIKIDYIYYPVEYTMIGTGSVETGYNPSYGLPNTIDTLAGIGTTIGTCFGTAGTTTIEDGKTTITYSGTTFIPNADLQTVVKLGKQEINWKWDFCQNNPECGDGHAACASCKADTILGYLMADKDNAITTSEVVKLDGTTYIAPVPATGNDASDLKDYNLETEFSIDITVTQVD